MYNLKSFWKDAQTDSAVFSHFNLRNQPAEIGSKRRDRE
jgi:hypothetical protein